MKALPRHILDRVERVLASHRGSKHTYDSVREPHKIDWANQPDPCRTFSDHPKIQLPTTLLDAPAGVLSVLESALDALPDSFVTPPQDLKTLASWLYMANGQTLKQQSGDRTDWLRTCPSSGALYPFEIYVAAFNINDLEPGLYHYSPREFALRKLREGPETLAQIKRGRPDLEFLKTLPAALLVSTIFSRSAWRYRARGYRYALLDAGHLVQNLVTAATGLGIQTVTRLRMTESTMRELIGLPPDPEFGEAESVQAMIAWGDRARAQQPAALPRSVDGGPGGTSFRPHRAGAAGERRYTFNEGGAAVASVSTPELFLPAAGTRTLAPITRLPLAASVTAYASILTAHEDCVAPGVAVREVRPPLTETSPLPPDYPSWPMAPLAGADKGKPLRDVLLKRRSPRDFSREPIARDAFRLINQIAFRGGSFFPLFPDGPHVALVRPFWLVNGVSGMDTGVWYFEPRTDAWHLLRTGTFRLEAEYLSLEQHPCGNAAAVCFMMASLPTLMSQGGPDLYRLAHLEAGSAGQRLSLAAEGLGYSCSGIGAFYDDEVRQFCGLAQSTWEPIYEVALGKPATEGQVVSRDVEEELEPDSGDWRG